MKQLFMHNALVCALALAEEGNLGRTAIGLHTSRSNISRKVKALQKSWEVELFRRNLAGFELTEAGQSAFREVRWSIEHLQRAFDRAIYTAVKSRRPFRIGHSLYIHGKVLPFLKQLGVPGPGFSRVVLKADATVHLQRRVLRGELHAGFGVMPIVDKDLWVTPIVHEYFSVCIPTTHPFKDKLRLSARELVNETLCWLPRSAHPALYDQVADYLQGVGHRLDNLQEARAIIQGIDMAAHRLGIALVPQSAERFQHAGVVFKPLTDKLIKIETALFIRRDQMKGAMQDFVNTALAELKPPKLESS